MRIRLKNYSPGYDLLFDIITIPSEAFFVSINEFVDAHSIPRHILLFNSLCAGSRYAVSQCGKITPFIATSNIKSSGSRHTIFSCNFHTQKKSRHIFPQHVVIKPESVWFLYTVCCVWYASVYHNGVWCHNVCLSDIWVPDAGNCVIGLIGFQNTVHCFVISVLTNTSSSSNKLLDIR